MPQLAKCPQCEHDLLVTEDLLDGAWVRCPSCWSFFQMKDAVTRPLATLEVIEPAARHVEDESHAVQTVDDIASMATWSGDKEDLEENHLLVRDFNLIKYESLPEDFVGLTKIRYKDAGTLATINTIDNKLDVIFHAPVTGVAPGQSAVIYEGDDLVGGGFIDRKKPAF